MHVPAATDPAALEALRQEAQILAGSAEPLLREGMAACRAAHGEDHPDYAALLENLGVLHQRRGNHATAESLLRQALAIREATLGEDHPHMGRSLDNLATSCAATGRFAEALPFLLQARVVEDRTVGTGVARAAAKALRSSLPNGLARV